MAKVCILNSSTNVVENICEVDDVNSVPDFLIGAGQSLATDHTGNIGDTWNGSSYDAPVEADTRTDEMDQHQNHKKHTVGRIRLDTIGRHSIG